MDPADEVQLATIARGDTGELRVTLSTWKGKRNVGLRVWFQSTRAGKAIPDKYKGISLRPGELRQVAEALVRGADQLEREAPKP